ncbi:MAG: TlpA family protein disulfide reductase [Paludibacteraceae bacterium]|nr:TlpA family protein disulfide reductase [Paludibacteraceae bacterium]
MKRIFLSLFATLCCLFSMAALPQVTLSDMDGNQVEVSRLAQSGKPVILSFFATWCKPCMRELKAIHELYPDWQDETGVEMYIISVDQAQDIRKVKPLVNGNGWEYHVLLDPNGTLKRAMNVQNIPHLFVIDSKGRTVYNHTGYTDGDEEELRRYLQ